MFCSGIQITLNYDAKKQHKNFQHWQKHDSQGFELRRFSSYNNQLDWVCFLVFCIPCKAYNKSVNSLFVSSKD